MNPFMLQMMMNPMGMGFMGCGCGVSMPYYGMDDHFSFMNFPIFRNTGYDYLLDPRLAMVQGQQAMMSGNMFGTSFLPLFNNFPGINGSWWNPNTKPETEEEKKAREAKEEEAKKPEAKKAASLKKTFDNIKKLAEKNKNFLTLDESIIKKAEDAMKKETAEEQLSTMKEVLSAIPENIIRKAILADENVVKKLKDAGYNFNFKNNEYSLPTTGLEGINMNQVHDDILSKRNFDAKGLGTFAAYAQAGSPSILALISAWNNTQEEKGILRFIAKNLPTEEAPLNTLKTMIVPQIINALISKADEYNGSAKIKADRDKLAKAKNDLIANFNSTNLNKVSDAFETLYARLRMQEAVQVREFIKNNSEFRTLNDVKEGIINDDMVVGETYASLKQEGISNPPKEENLDKVQTTTVVTVGDDGVIDKDKEYENNPQGLIDEHLAKDNKYLTEVGNTKVYQTKDIDGNGMGVKYYTVKDNKLIEVTKKADGSFEAQSDAPAVKSSEIEEYDSTILKIKSLIAEKKIEPFEGNFTTTELPYPVFRSTAKKTNEFYALIDNKFGKIKNCTNLTEDKTNKKISASGTGKTLDKLTASDLETDFDESKIKSEKWEKEQEKERTEKQAADRAAKFTSEKYTFKTLNNTEQLKSIGLEPTGVTGYYKTTDAPVLFFKYNEATQKLVHLSKVTAVNPDGTMVESNVRKKCREIQTTEGAVKELFGILNTTAYKYDNYSTYKSEEEVEKDLNTIRRKMNSFETYNKIADIINFIETYKNEAYHWWKENDPNICAAIVRNKIIPEADKKAYLKLIATRMLQIVEKHGLTFDNPDDKVVLENIKNGKLVTYNYEATGLSLQSTSGELDRIIDLILEKYHERF